MGDVINLNKFRKLRKKETRLELTRENIVKHGISKTEKNRQTNLNSMKSSLLDKKKLDDGTNDDSEN